MGDRVSSLICLCENEVLVEKEQKLETNEVAKEQKSKVTKKTEKLLQDEMTVMVVEANKLATSGVYTKAAASYTKAILASKSSNKIMPSIFVKRATCLARYCISFIYVSNPESIHTQYKN